MIDAGTLPASDDALVIAARAGSGEAFSELVDRYRSQVVRLAYRLVRDPDEAKDIAQDAFLRAYNRLGDFHPDRPFSRWLFVIARNASLDSLRRRRRASNVTIEEPVAGPSPEDEAVRRSDADSLHLALHELPAKYRIVLELYYIDELRYREIADVLEIPIGTVKTYISRAKRRLRDQLEMSEAVALAA